MSETSTETALLPGLMPRAEWAAKARKSDQTAKRWQAAGLIVVRYLGKDPFVDIEATAARVREDRPRARKRRAA